MSPHSRPLQWCQRLVIVAAMGAGLSGCRHIPLFREQEVDATFVCCSDMSWLSAVTISPTGCDAGDRDLLLSFCRELATALQAHGVADIRIRDNCEATCSADPLRRDPCPEAGCETESEFALVVSIADFRVYRPMRLAVDVRLVHTADQRELARVVRVFDGPQEAPLRESPRRFRLFRERDREARVDREAYTAFLSNSPSGFLTTCARQVTDQLNCHGPSALPMDGAVMPPPAEIPPQAGSPPDVGRATLELPAAESPDDPVQFAPHPPGT